MDRLEEIKAKLLCMSLGGADIDWLISEVERLRGAPRVFQDWQKVVTLTRTCTACPSQWQGEIEDGRMIYIRYRHGSMSVSVSPEPTKDVREAVRGPEVFGGGQSDGYMGDSDMFKMTGIRSIEVENPSENLFEEKE